MRKKVLSLILLWAALLALALIYTDRDEYTRRYEGGELAQMSRIWGSRRAGRLEKEKIRRAAVLVPLIQKGGEYHYAVFTISYALSIIAFPSTVRANRFSR